MQALEHLSDHDLALLARVASSNGRGGQGVEELRSRPGAVEELLRERATFDAVLGDRGRVEPFVPASPFLTFAVAVQRCADELRSAPFVHEWLGPRQRVAVFDVGQLRDFLAGPERRLFLAELLASYTKVTSGSFLVQTRRGWRRRRFSELDPVRLASLLEVVPDAERAGVYRRLGDLALFLTGVFPDHTAARACGQVDAARLMRAARLTTEPPAAELSGKREWAAVALMEELGRRWYRLAASGATSPTAALGLVEEVAARFTHARRILNLLTDSYLFPFRGRWFPAPGR
ncbi:MAG: hypothetical protein M3N68_10160 [Actinomycetota bacterium]|nr:hypothetical protein [Actinomycetota bacterium]